MISPKNNVMLPDSFAFVDIETTGTSFRFDRIIEVGILRVEKNKLIDTFQTLINPERTVDPYIEKMTGISLRDLEDAPLFSQVREKITTFLDDAIFVAHNVRFDYGFLKNELKQFNIPFCPKQLCTVKLSRMLYPQYTKHNLDSLIERFQFSCKKRHRAFDDAKVLWHFFKKIQKEFPQEKIEQAVSIILKKPSLPVGISTSIIEKIPTTPGVYIFYGADGMPLYVGKSINIKDRVLSHFTSDHLATKEMRISQQVTSIESIQTNGELGALLTESALVKKLQPLYNRKLRIKRKMIVIKKTTDTKGYTTVALEEVNCITKEDLDDIVAICKSKKQAKDLLQSFIKAYHLCEKKLGLQATKDACFSFHLGVCKGACMEKESVLQYNSRCILAFTTTQIKRWPFKGPIIITETNEDMEKDGYLLDKWCLLGEVKKTESSKISYIKGTVTFDTDIYRILVQYLKNPKHYPTIHELTVEEMKQLGEET